MAPTSSTTNPRARDAPPNLGKISLKVAMGSGTTGQRYICGRSFRGAYSSVMRLTGRWSQFSDTKVISGQHVVIGALESRVGRGLLQSHGKPDRSLVA